MEIIPNQIFSQEFINAKGLNIIFEFAIQILAGIATIIVGFWLSSRASRVVTNSMAKITRVDQTIVPMFSTLVRYAGMTLTLIVALGNFGVETTSIIAVLGAAGLAIGLALQGTLSNVAAGLMLIFLRPFKVGDWIEAAGISGKVREIGLFATVIDTFDNTYNSLPNSSIWSSNIINHSRYSKRRIDLDIGVSYETSLDKAEEALLGLANDDRVLKIPSPQFIVVRYDDSAIVIRLRVWSKYSDFFDLGYYLNRELKGCLERKGIEIPFPQRVVKMIENKKN